MVHAFKFDCRFNHPLIEFFETMEDHCRHKSNGGSRQGVKHMLCERIPPIASHVARKKQAVDNLNNYFG